MSLALILAATSNAGEADRVSTVPQTTSTRQGIPSELGLTAGCEGNTATNDWSRRTGQFEDSTHSFRLLGSYPSELRLHTTSYPPPPFCTRGDASNALSTSFHTAMANIPFTAVDTATRVPVKDEVESPSISSTNALARYEYEAGHANATEGTKILMVEWEDDDTTRGVRGDWHISWEGSTRVLPANDQPANDVNRMYFLLPPGVAVPTIVSLSLRPEDKTKPPVVWQTNPLPALFPPELGASARAAGKKGVLHTIWAKKRLQVLQKEIDAESRNNIEGIGLQMAVDEKEWIEQTFGVNARPAGLSLSLTEPSIAGPTSPRSPGGGRLMEKLAGLKLSTNEKDLTPGGSMPQSNPLSPESSDIAVSSFAVFKGANPSALAAKAPQQPVAPRRVAAAIPPPSIIAQQSSGMGSLNALSGPAPVFQSRGPVSTEEDDDNDDGLFALPISPRSPEVGKSPFSFGGNDTVKFLKEESAA
ncbi:hypothetical protein HBH56_065210 [Parastagonospora nodorum]|uniref:Uncharacterized protein n=3 Tax=Phaeosphaeria nodorum (strain SN15 / ATCC MYA-4574 / FGSC 10173) TaxID=321614 RepID=A0A7U2EWK7_PHANO|nr:hypothetical protein HBH56_065210 [Parastagonospora nodorum]QRC93243.1 hypothetical protein JI435_034920 [Parastagonospora nodorum SN15]KAH3932314.1 hypothetical protein HBH54_082880 [Parastagonospora nodorum]KAH3954788.1 hypothetical protein HBH53_011510 [Parastagonospora nodorum]KAH3988394.1 hypothetical protein HBH51_006350 [Parastagonospora nodorum]